MDRKDIYEHLAKIYLDASSKKQKKSKNTSRLLKGAIATGIVLTFGVIASIYALHSWKKPYNSEVALVISNGALKINFNFDPAKREIYSLDLKKLDLTKYKSLGFSLKKASYQDKISMRVEFTNSFKESSEVYIIDVPHKWQDYEIDFSEFKNIANWQEMSILAFAIEEWNAKSNKGVVYIDNVRFLK